MKHLLHTILISLFLFYAQISFAQNPSYDRYMESFHQELVGQSNNLIFLLELAHLSDVSNPEPAKALSLIPNFNLDQNSYSGYISSALHLLLNEHYDSAYFYFSVAYYLQPENDKPKYYLSELTDWKKGLVNNIHLLNDDRPDFNADEEHKTIPPKVSVKHAAKKLKEIHSEIIKIDDIIKIPQKASKQSYTAKPIQINVIVGSEDTILDDLYLTENKNITYFQTKKYKKIKPIIYDVGINKKEKNDIKDVVEMNEDLWKKQPKTELQIEVLKSISLNGENILRYLVITDGYVDIKRIDQNSLHIQSLKRGSTLVHIWDTKGRWTFTLQGVVPEPRFIRYQEKTLEDSREEYVESFKISHFGNWNSFYSGNSFKGLERQSLAFRNWVGLYGETPYGKVNGFVTYNKFAESTEIIEQSVGLKDGHIGTWRDINLRGWDSSKRFSNFSLPGRYFRGILIDSYALNKKIKYTYLRGQDRVTTSATTAASTQLIKSWLEGGKITLFPEDIHKNYSFNFARGWGEARTLGLQKRVFSVETNQQFLGWNVYSELAYDADEFAAALNTKFEGEDYAWRINLRNINENYKTITGRPGNVGEIGATVRFDKLTANWDFNADVDVYRNRDRPNPSDEDSLNIDFSTGSSYKFSESLKLNSTLFFVHTPQLLSPATNFRINNTLSKRFKIWEKKYLSTSIGYSYQQNRYSLTPSSEFNRKSIRVGARLPIWRGFNYYINYEQLFVHNVQDNTNTTPRVMDMGLTYSKTITDKVTSHTSITYRNEQNTSGEFSFLSGTDDLRTTIGVTYNPVNDMEIFMDGSFRNIWTESNNEIAFTEMDVRVGIKSTWDLLFRWNPQGKIQGLVFNDLNNNGLYEENEPGISGVNVLVGKKSVRTNQYGLYYTKIRAKAILVSIDFSSLPSGYFLSTNDSQEINIEQHKTHYVRFGLTSQTSLRGLVFIDANDNNLYDLEESLISHVKITLDNKNHTRSDFQGSYQFSNIKAGEHDIAIDINSIPIKYLPKIKLKNKIFISEGSNFNYLIPLKLK